MKCIRIDNPVSGMQDILKYGKGDIIVHYEPWFARAVTISNQTVSMSKCDIATSLPNFSAVCDSEVIAFNRYLTALGVNWGHMVLQSLPLCFLHLSEKLSGNLKWRDE